MSDSLEIIVRNMFIAASNVLGVSAQEAINKPTTGGMSVLADVRHVVALALHVRGRYGLEQVGKLLGRDHSTIHHSVKNTPTRIEAEPTLRRAYEAALSVLDPTIELPPRTANELRKRLYALQAIAEGQRSRAEGSLAAAELFCEQLGELLRTVEQAAGALDDDVIRFDRERPLEVRNFSRVPIALSSAGS